MVAGDPDGVDAGQLQIHAVDDLVGAGVEVGGELLRVITGLVAGQLVVVEVTGSDDQGGEEASGGDDGILHGGTDIVPGLMDVGEGDQGVLLCALGKDDVDVHVDLIGSGIGSRDIQGVKLKISAGRIYEDSLAVCVDTADAAFYIALAGVTQATVDLPAGFAADNDLAILHSQIAAVAVFEGIGAGAAASHDIPEDVFRLLTVVGNGGAV